MKINKSMDEFLKEISSDSPAPGGGSVAAISGCLGAALVSMVCGLSIGKKSYKEFEDELKLVLSEAEELREELFNLAGKDVEAFNEVMEVLKKMKNTDDKTDEELLQNAYKKAADVPLDVARRCFRVMELAKITALKGNKNAITDSGVGSIMAYSGLRGAILNVRVNLKFIEDKYFTMKMESEIEELHKRAEEIIKIVMIEVDGSIGG